MAYKGHKAGSRKGRVHEHFDQYGEAAAITFGTKLGLASTTVSSWIGTWKKTPDKVTKEPKGVTSSNKCRVYASYDPDKLGTVVQAGPEVTEIKWDNGGYQCVSNEYVKEWVPRMRLHKRE